MDDQKDKQILLKLPEETHRKLRLQAADLNISLNDFIIELIENEYDRVDIILPKKRVPSSKAEEASPGYSLTSSMRLMRESVKAE